MLLLGTGVVVYYAYQRGRKSGLVESTQLCGETSDIKRRPMNTDQSVQETHAELEALGGSLRYFDAERLGTPAY